MRHLIRIGFALCLAVLSWKVAAEPRSLSPYEITSILTGNTASGLWDGTAYRQYFGSDGLTIYATRKSQSSLGQWRVRNHPNAYESWWKGSGWSAYAIVNDGEQLLWKTKTGKRYPFKVLQGQQLVWPEQ